MITRSSQKQAYIETERHVKLRVLIHVKPHKQTEKIWLSSGWTVCELTERRRCSSTPQCLPENSRGVKSALSTIDISLIALFMKRTFEISGSEERWNLQNGMSRSWVQSEKDNGTKDIRKVQMKGRKMRLYDAQKISCFLIYCLSVH